MSSTIPTRPIDPTAVVGRRLLAAAIDLGILWVFTATFWALASREVPAEVRQFGIEPCTGRSLCTDVNDRYVSGWPVVILLVVSVVYLVGVFVLERGLTGRTIGTMLTGLVTVGEDGRPLGVGPAFVRSVAGVVDYLPCCLPVVGVATIAATPGHRRVGDMAASSYVVGHEWFGRPIQLSPPEPEAPAPPPSTIPATAPIPPTATPPRSPSPFAPPEPASVTSMAAPGTHGEPVWDPQRGTYLLWDPTRRQWLQHDQPTGEWQQYDHATRRWRSIDR